ncbi:MAG: hypothetical protein N2712_07650 [Brevinematales bacterium]|nr:hypothetical protein [Brevinematales bacterium]
MGLLEKAKSYREKLILDSLSGNNNLFSIKPITIEDLRIIKEYYERNLSPSKFGLLSLLVKVAEDVKYFSSVESIVSSLYTVVSRVGGDVEGIGYLSDKFDSIYGDIDEKEIPTFFGTGYYIVQNGNTYIKVSGEMSTFLVAKCRGEIKLDDDADMVLKKCIDVLSVALRLVQFKGIDIKNFYGFRNSFALSEIQKLSKQEVLDDNKMFMLLYYTKELFGLNFIILFNNNLKPILSIGFPMDILENIKITSDMMNKNINNMEVIDLELSKLFSYGSYNIAFTKIKGKTICMGANYDLSLVLKYIESL